MAFVKGTEEIHRVKAEKAGKAIKERERKEARDRVAKEPVKLLQ